VEQLELTRSSALHLTILFYTLSALLGVAFLFAVPFAKLWLCKTLTLLGFLAQTAYLAVTWAASGDAPIFRPVEAQFTIVWAVVFAFSIADLVSRTRYMLSFVMPAVALFSFAVLFFIEGRAGARGPQDGLMAAHVGLAMTGYAAFVFAFVAGLMYLAQVRQLKTKRFQSLFDRLPALDVLDRMNLGAVVVGLVAMSVSIAAVLLWAFGHGTYSASWWIDPRILAPSILWVFYILLLLARLTAAVRGRKVALLTVFGFLGMIVLLIGMSFVTGQGPHPVPAVPAAR
jgi:ABC-type transport system involved in cytochrome c biogenesis permease subunit